MYADDILLLHTLPSGLSISTAQLDLDNLTSWLSSNNLSVNLSKSKYMYFSFRHQSFFNSIPSLLLNTLPIERVYSFKYLGLLFTCNLSWSNHISSIISRAKRLIGLIYRQFYHQSSSQTLLSLYLTIVRPILEYASPIWDPSSHSLSSSVESVQFFALKMVLKSWSISYPDTLSSLNLPTLHQRRQKAKLILLFKLQHNMIHSTLPPLQNTPRPPMSLRNYSSSNLIIPRCRTSSLYNSFIPSASRLWNSLPSFIKESHSLSLLKFSSDTNHL